MKKRKIDKEREVQMQIVSAGEMSLDERKDLIAQLASMLVDLWEKDHLRNVGPSARGTNNP